MLKGHPPVRDGLRQLLLATTACSDAFAEAFASARMCGPPLQPGGVGELLGQRHLVARRVHGNESFPRLGRIGDGLLIGGHNAEPRTRRPHSSTVKLNLHSCML